MVENSIIEALCGQLKETVCPQLLLEKPRDCVEEAVELVHPAVFPGYVPPRNFLPDGFAVPSIVAGFKGGKEERDASKLTVQLTFAVFAYDGSYAEGEVIQSMRGYSDLLHVVTTTRAELMKRMAIADKAAIVRPFVWKMYEEQPYPFWYAAAEFDVEAYPMQFENSFLI